MAESATVKIQPNNWKAGGEERFLSSFLKALRVWVAPERIRRSFILATGE
jgi:hypothetical protein